MRRLAAKPVIDRVGAQHIGVTNVSRMVAQCDQASLLG
jgi:hypothetical protein